MRATTCLANSFTRASHVSTNRHYASGDKRPAYSVAGMLATEEEAAAEGEAYDEVRKPRLARPVAFAVFFSIGSYFGAAYLTQRLDAATNEAYKRRFSFLSNDKAVKEAVEADACRKTLEQLRRRNAPTTVRVAYQRFQEWWIRKRDEERATLVLIGMNAVPFLAWRVPLPAVQGFMYRHFMHSPLSGRSYTLLTSVFSHKSFAHFAFNMIAFYSFGPPAFHYLSDQRYMYPWKTEDNRLMNWYSTYHHIAFFMTAGVIASVVPHCVRVTAARRFQQQLLSQTTGRVASAATSWTAIGQSLRLIPSLGASGAIYSTLFLCAYAYPQMSVSLILLPFIPIKIGYGVAGIAALDAAGIIRGWQMFDHWAHLTGAAVGVWAFYQGSWVWFQVQQATEGGRLKGGSEYGR
ncbi:hypothetical protein LTS18_011679 [Coniosporium uncinatum]|uniref:Uncharacterized protein n=1 Tax=Coniosporium uncinatum TaxID=93489 RepID=A0ACC3DW80_9PEZI|nr:hypothetical protein LTS18_011679 [Coniosporium uncinatum]